MFLIRAAQTSDLAELLRLAKLVHFINLPPDRRILAQLLKDSTKSFNGKQAEPSTAKFLFVLEDLEKKRLVGTSLILAQHGTPEEPHLFFKVLKKKKKSKGLKKGIEHTILRLGFDYHGPTELGALMLMPEYRGRPEKFGLLLSYVRFLFIRARRQYFQDELLVELMPPLTKDQDSHLWQAIGRKFTGLPYWDADVLSRKDKEFVTALFPEGDVYTCLLPKDAQDSIGKVGEATEPVRKMLETIGFKYTQMIDPFDGGPHYWAETDKVLPVKNTQMVHWTQGPAQKARRQVRGLCMVFDQNGPMAFVCDGVLVKTASVPRLYINDNSLSDNIDWSRVRESYFLEIEI